MRKIIFLLFVLYFILLFPSRSPAFELSSLKYVLDNGLTVVIRQMPSSPMVSVYGLVKTGSATEGKYLGSGVSHFLEHMLFKGTAARQVGEIPAEIQALGGTINASTSFDYTIYTITVPYEFFDMALDILSDMLMNAVIDPLETERERDVIHGEMRLYKDNPNRKLSLLTFSNVYIKHPYRFPIIGYRTLLDSITRDQLFDYYKTHYIPSNIIVSIAGNIQVDETLSKVKQQFHDFKRQFEVSNVIIPEPQQISPRRMEVKYPTDITRMSMAYGSVSLLNEDLYALDVLAKILGQGFSSRLYLDVYKKKGLVYSISSINYTPNDRGVFEIESVLNYDNVEPAIATIKEHIEQIKNKGVREEELDKSVRQVLSGHIQGHETSSGVAHAAAIHEAFTGDYLFSRKYLEGVRAVTAQDIKRVARKYLKDSRLSVTILKPESIEEKVEDKIKEERAGTIQKHSFKNGMTVLIREEHALALVSIRLMANGGIRQQPKELSGLSGMVGSMLSRGTKRFSARQISTMTESKGISFGGYGGKNSFGLSMELLSEDLDFALELLEEIVKNVSFPEDEIKKVKEGMLAGIRQRKDDIRYVSGQALRELLFINHPFRIEDGGTVESIEKIKRDDLMKYYRLWMKPNNMVLSVFGDMDSQDVLKKLKKHFGGLKQKEVHLKLHTEEPIDRPRQKDIAMDKEQAIVMIGFHGTTLYDDDYYGLSVLTSIMGSSFSGRLFKKVREEFGQAYTLGGRFIPGIDAGYVYFYILTAPEHVKEVEQILKSEIQDLQTHLVTDKELKDIKSYLKGRHKSDHQTNSSLNFTVSLDELYGLGADYYNHYDRYIDAVTKEDIKRLAEQYFNLNRSALIITKPDYSK